MITYEHVREVWQGDPPGLFDEWSRRDQVSLGRLVSGSELITAAAARRFGWRVLVRWREAAQSGDPVRVIRDHDQHSRKVLRAALIANGAVPDDRIPAFVRSAPDAWIRPNRQGVCRWPDAEPRISLWHLEQERLRRGFRRHLNGPDAVPVYTAA